MTALWAAFSFASWVDYVLWAVGIFCLLLFALGGRAVRRDPTPRALWIALALLALVVAGLWGLVVIP